MTRILDEPGYDVGRLGRADLSLPRPVEGGVPPRDSGAAPPRRPFFRRHRLGGTFPAP